MRITFIMDPVDYFIDRVAYEYDDQNNFVPVAGPSREVEQPLTDSLANIHFSKDTELEINISIDELYALYGLDDSGWQNSEPVEIVNRAQELQGSGGDQGFEMRMILL